MRPPNHYRTLGVSRFASDEAVRRAYIALMKRHHGAPDDDVLTQDRLRRISAAYWELRHPERRAAYDAALRAKYQRHLRSGYGAQQFLGAAGHPRALRPRLRTKWLFLLWLVLLGTGVWWVAKQRGHTPDATPAALDNPEIRFQTGRSDL